MLEVNFLPWRKRQRHKRRIKIIVCLLLGVMIIVAFVCFVFGALDKKQEILKQQIVLPQQNKKKNCLLSEYSINNLKMIGVLIGKRHQWSFISDPNKKTLKVRVDDELGKECFKITNITRLKITLAKQMALSGKTKVRYLLLNNKGKK
jgi:Tfp pilus assembly protein PilN